MQQFRNLLKGWVGKVLLIIFILPFVFFGIEGLILGGGNKDVALSVNGADITNVEIDRGIAAQRDAMVQRMGGNIEASFFTDEMLRPRVIESLIQKQLLAQAIEDEGLYVSGDTIKRYVRTMPQFQNEQGEFSQQQLELVLARAGYSATRFFDELREGMIAEQLQQGVGVSAFMTENELKHLVQLDGQKRDLSYATIKVDPIKDSIKLSDEDIAGYFAENKAQYRTEEKVQIRYIQFAANDFADNIEISEDDLMAGYEQYTGSVQGQERRRASHILVEVNDDRDDEEARARIDEAKDKLDAGGEFVALAKEYSDDAATASAGGDLDFAGRGIYDESFENALFALKEGETSDVVKTEFGYHLIRLTGIESQPVASFEDKKAELRQQLVQDKSASQLNDAIDELNRLAYESGDLEAIAETFAKTPVESAFFTRRGGADITADKKIIDAAFSDSVLKDGANSEVIELADGNVVVLRVAGHEPARDQTLDEVKDQVVAAVTEQMAREKAKQVAGEVVTKLRSGTAMESLVEEYGFFWTHTADVGRQNTELSRTLVSKLFEMPRPAEGAQVVDKTSLPSGDQEILVLKKVQDGEFKLTPEEVLQNSLAGASRVGQLEFDNYMSTLKENAKIVYN